MNRLLLVVILLGVAITSSVAQIYGPSPVVVNQPRTYQANTAGVAGNWTITPAGNGVVNSTWAVGNVFYASITLTTAAVTTLTFTDPSIGSTFNKSISSILGAPTPTHGSRCDAGTVTLSATPGGGGTKVRWYTTMSNLGNYFAETNSWTTPILGATTTYYITTYNPALNVQSSPRIPITATIGTVGNPTALTSVPKCGGLAELSATKGTNATTLNWWNGSGGTATLLYTGLTYTVASSGTYWVSSYNATTKCESGRVSIVATVGTSPKPSPPVQNGPFSKCGNDTGITLTSAPGAGGDQVKWYYASNGYITTGNSYTPPHASALYIARTFNSTTLCESDPISVVVNIGPTQVSPNSPTSTIIHGEGKVFLWASAYGDDYAEGYIAIPPGEYFLRWYEQSSGGVKIAETPYTIPYETPYLKTQKNYYVSSYNASTSCESSRILVVAKVLPLIAPTNQTTTVIRAQGVKTEADISVLADSLKPVTVIHYDGLLRVNQEVAVKASPTGKDVVQPVAFDSYGRSSKSYLPYVASTTTGQYQSNYKASQAAFYNNPGDNIADDLAPWDSAVFEASPFGRLLQQGGIGSALQISKAHTQKMGYSYNDANEVRKFNSDGSSAGFYATNTLSKVKSTDADGNHSIIYLNEAGHVILKKQQLDKTIDGVLVNYLETYYIYSEFSQLQFIINPKGVSILKTNGWSFASIKEAYTYQLKYDSRSRLIEKKTPGQAWMFFAYDNLDRMVLFQDGQMRDQNKWAFTKYDRKGRPVAKGLYKNTTQTTRADVQSLLNGLYSASNVTYGVNAWFESRGTALHGYDNTSFPKVNSDNSALDVMSVNYYDSYDFNYDGTVDYAYTQQGLANENTPGLPFDRSTGSKRIILGSSNWLYSYIFYDVQGRPIQVRSNNHLNLTMADLTTNVFSYDGLLKQKKVYHNAGPGKVTTIINNYAYDKQGRLVMVKQNNNSAGDQILAKYEYNELGQLVDKKLHRTPDGNYMQSVDYRFTIRGQLASINNAALDVNSNNNDDLNDYFGMEFLFNNVEVGLGNDSIFNGNISAIKWKGSTATVANGGQKSYKFVYDKSGRLESAASQMKSAAGWDQEVGALNESMTYDHNGNIKTLQRNYKNVAVGLMDNLTYSYNSSNADRLEKVTDASLVAAGFDNGASANGNDYKYDTLGNITSDKNKGMDSIKYNVLGKVCRIKFSDGKVLTYTYDAAGTKLEMKVIQGAVARTTSYANGFVYEEGLLSFFGSPEGRVVNNNGALEYQYAIADNQGNTRLVFSSITPTPDSLKATMETANESSEKAKYLKWADVRRVNSTLFDHTNAGGGTNYAVRLSGTTNETYGLARSLAVVPGDKIKAEVYAKYVDPNSSNWSAALNTLMAQISTQAAGVVVSGEGYGTINGATIPFAGMLGHSGQTGNAPKAYLNWIVFDNNFNLLTAGFQRMTESARETGTDVAHELLQMPEFTVTEPGFMYIYFSNENGTPIEVYFDDFKVTHTKTNIAQYNEYYPFGLQTSNSWSRETNSNNYLYNAGSELNKDNGWYEMFYRGYDPATGRMLQVDPYAMLYASATTYNYSLNNPVMLNDPSGGVTNVVGYTDGQLHTIFRQQRLNGGTSDFGSWAANNLDFGDVGDGRQVDGGDGNSYGVDENGVFGKWVLKESYDVGFYSINEYGEKTWIRDGRIIDVYKFQEIPTENIILNFSEAEIIIRQPGSSWKVINAMTLDHALEKLKGKNIRNLLIIGHANIDHITFGDRYNQVAELNGVITTEENLSKLNSILQHVISGGNVVFEACGADASLGEVLQNYLRNDINVFMNGGRCVVERYNSDHGLVWDSPLSKSSYSFRNVTTDPEGCNRLKNITLKVNGTFRFIK